MVNKIGSMIMILSLLAFLIWLAMPVQLFSVGVETQKLFNKYPILMFPYCHYEKIRYDCQSGCLEYESKCEGTQFLGLCFGNLEKTCKKFGVRCKEKTILKCDSKEAKPVHPTPRDYYGPAERNIDNNIYHYEPPKYIEVPTVTEKEFTTLTCGGPVIANKYIQGFKYIVEQKVRETCINGKCTRKVLSSKIIKDCTEKLKVCRVAYNKPKCYFYPIELKIDAILQRIGIFE